MRILFFYFTGRDRNRKNTNEQRVITGYVQDISKFYRVDMSFMDCKIDMDHLLHGLWP
jgi:hypothetical protein